MTRRTRSGALAVAVASGWLGAVGLACAGDDGAVSPWLTSASRAELASGRDLAAGWRALLAIRGAALGEEIALPRADYANAKLAGSIASPKLTETSGLAISRRRDDLLWAINDSGTPPRLHALGVDGADLGFATIEGVDAVDWEDLASFELDGRSYLLIADTGDNLSWRKRSLLLVVEEPELTGDALPAGSVSKPAWRIPFRFEDGPRDCEAVAVDSERMRVLLISKRTEPPGLYQLPLLPSDPAMGNTAGLVARRIGDVPGIPPPTRSDVEAARWLGRYFAMPTAFDISPDGRLAVVLTYREAYLYARSADEPWAKALGRPPQRIDLPALAQAEAIAFARDGRTIFVTSEGLGAPLFKLGRLGEREGALSLRRE
ncbi:MAG: hypothetical protein JRG80_08310 [Deltaproteobacteria bacterium]|nr:hypothetical protein [Deltaproteobacteria bacterium]MBW2399262.1 hypothetical protein [Deltaproteobacteria bacterium]